MTLIEYARLQGIGSCTAGRWWKAGKTAGYHMDTGPILVTARLPVSEAPATAKVALYTRVFSSEHQARPDGQAGRLIACSGVCGHQVCNVVKEVGSGVTDNQPKFLAVLADPSIGRIVIEHKGRGTRFGFHHLQALLRISERGKRAQ